MNARGYCRVHRRTNVFSLRDETPDGGVMKFREEREKRLKPREHGRFIIALTKTTSNNYRALMRLSRTIMRRCTEIRFVRKSDSRHRRCDLYRINSTTVVR